MDVSCIQNGNAVLTTGVYIGAVECARTSRRITHNKPEIKSYKFLPYLPLIQKTTNSIHESAKYNTTDTELDEYRKEVYYHCLSEVVKLAASNLALHIRALILDPADDIKPLLDMFDALFFHKVTVVSNNEPCEKDTRVTYIDLNLLPQGQKSIEPFDMVFATDAYLCSEDAVTSLDPVMSKNGFVLVLPHFEENQNIENYKTQQKPNLQELMDSAGYSFVCQKQIFGSVYCNLWRKFSPLALKTVIKVSSDDFAWISSLHTILKSPKNQEIWLVSNEITNGLLGFVHCLKLEHANQDIR